jgi:hypothetical protein
LTKNDFIKVSEQFGVKFTNQRLLYKNWNIGYFWVRRKSGHPLQVYVSVYFGGYQNRTQHLHEYEDFLGKAVYEAKHHEEDRRIDEIKKDF